MSFKATAFFALAFLAVSVSAAKKDRKSDDENKSNYTVTDEAWFDFVVYDHPEKGDDLKGTIRVGLFGKTTPMTVMNFKEITKGFNRGNLKLKYKGSYLHKIVQDFTMQMGDVVVGDGSGSKSIYGDKFLDENFVLSHSGIGLLAMANHGPDTNGCQFFITLTKCRWLDGKHVVFGKVIEGYEFLFQLNEVPANNKYGPLRTIKITDCGLDDITPYDLTEDEYEGNFDLRKEA